MIAENREQTPDGSISCGVFIPLPYNLAKYFPKKPEDDSNPHITLLYAGELSPCDYRDFVDVMRNASRNIAPFPLDLSHYSEFLNNDGQRIAHMSPGILGRSILAKIHGKLRRAADEAGITLAHTYGPLDDKKLPYELRFTAHSTLAYQSKCDGPYSGPKPTGNWRVKELECWGHERFSMPLGRIIYDQPIGLAREPLEGKYPRAVKEDRIPGGRADKREPKDFDPKQLAMGIKVEREHTNSDVLAREIAMDHLTENPRYYTALAKMEKQFEGNDFSNKVHPLALLARKRAAADEKEGHDAAEYWRGWAAGSFLTANDSDITGYKKEKKRAKLKHDGGRVDEDQVSGSKTNKDKLENFDPKRLTVISTLRRTSPLSEVRDSCLGCVRKHLSQALVLMHEVKQGYPLHRWIAVGHMGEAADEALKKYPKLANEIREQRLKYMANAKYDVPIMDLITKASKLAGDLSEGRRRETSHRCGSVAASLLKPGNKRYERWSAKRSHRRTTSMRELGKRIAEADSATSWRQQTYSGSVDDTPERHWNVGKLYDWASERYPATEFAITKLSHILKPGSGTKADEPFDSKEFKQRAAKAKMFPIMVTKLPDGSHDVIDGAHRLHKATAAGDTHIHAHVIPWHKLPSSARIEEDDSDQGEDEQVRKRRRRFTALRGRATIARQHLGFLPARSPVEIKADLNRRAVTNKLSDRLRRVENVDNDFENQLETLRKKIGNLNPAFITRTRLKRVMRNPILPIKVRAKERLERERISIDPSKLGIQSRIRVRPSSDEDDLREAANVPEGLEKHPSPAGSGPSVGGINKYGSLNYLRFLQDEDKLRRRGKKSR